MTKRGQEPAYPTQAGAVTGPGGSFQPLPAQGMSTRLRIASEQMAGLMANPDVVGDARDVEGAHVKDMAQRSLLAADVLLAAEEESRG